VITAPIVVIQDFGVLFQKSMLLEEPLAFGCTGIGTTIQCNLAELVASINESPPFFERGL